MSSDLAHSVLEEIQYIEYNLNNSVMLQLKVKADLQYIDTINVTYYAADNKVTITLLS